MPATAATAAAVVTMAGRVRGARSAGAQGLRPLAVWHFPGRPARSALVSTMDEDQLRLGKTQEAYAEGFGVSRRTYLRFRAGGKLPKQLRLALLQQRPKWKRLVDKVVEEDVRYDDFLLGLR